MQSGAVRHVLTVQTRGFVLDSLRDEAVQIIDNILSGYVGKESEVDLPALLKKSWQVAKQDADAVAKEALERKVYAAKQAAQAKASQAKEKAQAKAQARAADRAATEARQDAERQAAKARRAEERARQLALEADRQAAREAEIVAEKEKERQERLLREEQEKEAAMLQAASEAVTDPGAIGIDGRSLAGNISDKRRRRASMRASSKGLLGRLRRGSVTADPAALEALGEEEEEAVQDRDEVFEIGEDAMGDASSVHIETVEQKKRRNKERERVEQENIKKGREAAAKVNLDRINGMLHSAGQSKIEMAEYEDFRDWMARRDGGEMESTLDPEDYEDLYVEMHEVYQRSDDYADFVVDQRRQVQAKLDKGEWEDDEGFLLLHEAMLRLKAETAKLGLEEEFEEVVDDDVDDEDPPPPPNPYIGAKLV